MQSPVTFDRPWLLLLLPIAIAYFWAMTRRSYAGLHPTTQRLALVTRCVAASLLIGALSGMHLLKRSDKLTTLFVLDVSRSIRPDQRAQGLEYIRKALDGKRTDDQAGVVVFGRTAYVEDPPSDTLQQLEGIHAAVAGDATDLSAALRIAGDSFPADSGKKIVLLSDGNENIGSAADEIDSLKAAGVRVDVAPTALGQETGGQASAEAMVDDVTLPTRTRKGAPFLLRVIVSSTVAQTSSLSLMRDGAAIAQQKVTLKPGKNAFTFQEKIAQTGFHRYDAEITPSQDAIPENNHAYGYVSVIGRPRILYVADTNVPAFQDLKRAMAAQNIDVDIQTPGAIPASVPALSSYDSIVLSNVPSAELSPVQMTAMEEAVKDFGVGLGMVGGENSFAAGQYNGTPIEAALPVRMDVRKQRRLPPAAVVVVLDASGSMGATESGVEKVQLGARAAVQLMGALQPDDEVAVTAVTETTSIVVPLESASKANSARSAIDSLHAGGGGIYCRQGLEDAYAILQHSNAPIKHVIMCADTSDSEQQEDCVAMAGEMLRRYHISTTVCGIGHREDQHVPFQRAVAKSGGGQLFVVNQAGDLPRLFQRDVQTIQQSLYVEKPILPRYNSDDPIIGGIAFNTEPPLLGYNLTTAKPGATVALTSPDHDDPVFAYWRYGLGRTFAFTSDDRAHWAIQWLPWQGYPQFWAQTLRWSLRSNASADFQTAVDNDGGKGHIAVDAFSTGGGFLNKANMTARVVAPDLTVKQVPLAQTAPGRYEAAFDTDQTGAYMVNVQNGSAPASAGAAAAQTIGLVVPYSPEYRTLGPNLPLLTQLSEATGGKIQNDPAQIFRDAKSWVVGVLDLAPALILLSALLFFVDIAVRRLAIRPQQVRESARQGVQTAQTRLAAVTTGRAPQPETMASPFLNRLLERKTATRGQILDDEAQSTTDRLLNRRASRGDEGDENPFPYVASLKDKPKSPPASPPSSGTSDGSHTSRLLDAKRRAQQKDD